MAGLCSQTVPRAAALLSHRGFQLVHLCLGLRLSPLPHLGFQSVHLHLGLHPGLPPLMVLGVSFLRGGSRTSPTRAGPSFGGPDGPSPSKGAMGRGSFSFSPLRDSESLPSSSGTVGEATGSSSSPRCLGLVLLLSGSSQPRLFGKGRRPIGPSTRQSREGGVLGRGAEVSLDCILPIRGYLASLRWRELLSLRTGSRA